jgi:hypothetical protein
VNQQRNPELGTSPFAAQIAMFGYAVDGDWDLTAQVAEERYDWGRTADAFWDKTVEWLYGTVIIHGDSEPRPVRPWSALPWLSVHSLRGHMPWPGL